MESSHRIPNIDQECLIEAERGALHLVESRGERVTRVSTFGWSFKESAGKETFRYRNRESQVRRFSGTE